MTKINDPIIADLQVEIAEKTKELDDYIANGGGIDLRVRKMELFKLCCRLDTLRLQATVE